MNVPADALFELAQVCGAPSDARAEGVVRWATEKLKEQALPPDGVVVSRAVLERLRKPLGESLDVAEEDLAAIDGVLGK